MVIKIDDWELFFELFDIVICDEVVICVFVVVRVEERNDMFWLIVDCVGKFVFGDNDLVIIIIVELVFIVIDKDGDIIDLNIVVFDIIVVDEGDGEIMFNVIELLLKFIFLKVEVFCVNEIVVKVGIIEFVVLVEFVIVEVFVLFMGEVVNELDWVLVFILVSDRILNVDEVIVGFDVIFDDDGKIEFVEFWWIVLIFDK